MKRCDFVVGAAGSGADRDGRPAAMSSSIVATESNRRILGHAIIEARIQRLG